MLFPYAQMRVKDAQFWQRKAQKIKRVLNSVSGTPQKPMEVPRTLGHKTLGKSLITWLVAVLWKCPEWVGFWTTALEGKWAHTEKRCKSLTPVGFQSLCISVQRANFTGSPFIYRDLFRRSLARIPPGILGIQARTQGGGGGCTGCTCTPPPGKKVRSEMSKTGDKVPPR